jgi:hypothetical protein
MPQTGYWPQQYYSTTAATINYTPIITTTAISPNTIWQNWVNTSATTITYVPTYSNEVWHNWANQLSQYDYRYTLPAPTPEAIREGEERYERQRQELQAARTRARVLLGEFLNEGQKTELERHGRFHVTGSKGRRYCIRTSGQQGNVDLLTDKGDVQATLCAHPRGGLPDGDAWLMQLIEIRHDEDRFLHVANVHRGQLPRELVRAY